MSKYDVIEDILGECFDAELLTAMQREWKAFYNAPEKYRGTIVVDMVNQWIDGQPVRYC